MKKRLVLCFLLTLLSVSLARAQTSKGNITNAECITIAVDKQATVGIQVAGTWTGTLQPKISIQGQTAANIQVTPSTSSTAQATITGNGVFRAVVAGGSVFSVCGNTVATGTANVFLNASTASAGLSGGAGGGTVTAVTATAPIVSSGGTAPDISMTNQGTTTTVLHGNAAGNPTFGAVNYATDGTGVLAPANGGVASISTAAQGYFWGGFVDTPTTAGATGTIAASANQVRAYQFVLPVRIAVSRVSWFTGANPGDTVDFGIYSATGGSKLVSSGATVTSGTNAAQTVTISTVTLDPGIYYFAWTETGTPTTTILASVALTNIMAVTNVGSSSKRKVLAGNTASAGTLPSSLGTITTADTTTVVPYVLFEP